MASAGSEAKSKKPRKRLKKICQQIKEQMEFYFGDANLHKDRFLKKEMDNSLDGYVDLGMFIKFNKIKVLTEDVAVIAKSLKNSNLLEVNHDGTKVKRLKPLSDRKDVDNRTVYVECLPNTVNHEWVKTLFSQCGTVEYVSLPKYRTTGDIKGFAFVEFATEDEAKKACKVLNNPPVSEADNKPGKFPKGSKDVLRLKGQLKDATGDEVEETNGGAAPLNGRTSEPVKDDTPTVCSNTHQSPKKAKKRKLGDDKEEAVDHDEEAKKVKVDVKNQPENKATQEKNVKPQKSKVIEEEDDKPASTTVSESEIKTCLEKVKIVKAEERHDSESDKETERGQGKKVTTPSCMRKRKGDEGLLEEEKESKKVRINETVEVREQEKTKRKRKKKKNKEKVKETPELRVLSKKEWLVLRNEYISLQKASMKHLKESLAKVKHDQHTEQAQLQAQQEKSRASHKKIEFLAGVIIMVTSEEPLLRKSLKELLSCHGDIAYIDLKDGDSTGHVRCQSAEAASSIAQCQVKGLTLNILTGKAEEGYWTKLLADQENKLSSKTKKTKKRGKDKLLDKAEKLTVDTHKKTHVVFDD